METITKILTFDIRKYATSYIYLLNHSTHLLCVHVLCSKCVRSSLSESTSSSLGILEYTSFSSSESESGSASDVNIATNPTTTFASSSASSFSDPDSLSKSSQVAIKLFLICFLNFLELKFDFFDLSFDFSF